MKTNRIIIAALFLAAAVSCQKDGFVDSENVRETESAVLVTGEQTKTSLNGKEIHWTGDDVVAVFDNANYKNTFNITEVDGSYAAFSGEVTTGTTQIYAIYPANLAVSADGSSLKVNIPTDQTSKVGSFDEEHNISVAKGAKTPGVETIGDITFKNVCALLKFTIPSYIEDAKSVTLTINNRTIAGEATIDYSGDTPALSMGSGASNSITMKGSYPAGSEFLFVLAPGEVRGCTVTVTTAQTNWTITKTSTFTLEAGRYKNLGVLELEQVSASASAAHTYNGSTLTGTNVTLNLNIPAATQDYITAMSLVVKNSNGEEVRSSSSIESKQTLAANDSWPYLPQGTYTVSGSYTLADGTEKEISSVSFTSPAPVFNGTVNVAGTTSYSIYYNNGGTKNPDGANAHAAETISSISASCPAVANISSEILAKIPVNYSVTLDGTELKRGTTTSTSAIAVDDQTGKSWGVHTLAATFTFDGVAISGSTDCHITGLPYSMSKNACKDHWTLGGGAAGFDNNDTRIYLNHSTNNSATLNIHAPSSINVTLTTERISLTCPTIFGSPSMTVTIGGSQKEKFTASSGTNKTTNWDNKSWTGTITSKVSTIVYNRTYFAGREAWGGITNVGVSYR